MHRIPFEFNSKACLSENNIRISHFVGCSHVTPLLLVDFLGSSHITPLLLVTLWMLLCYTSFISQQISSSNTSIISFKQDFQVKKKDYTLKTLLFNYNLSCMVNLLIFTIITLKLYKWWFVIEITYKEILHHH